MNKTVHKKIAKTSLLPLLLFASSFSYGQYCIPTSTNECSTYFDEVNTFVLNGINGTAINEQNSGCSPAGYADNTNMTPVDLMVGGSYTANVSTVFYVSPTNADYCAIWMDLNDDNTFSATELVGSYATPMQPDVETSVPIAIPATAPVGNHRMRVTVYWFVKSAGTGTIKPTVVSPCNTPSNTNNTYTYGETEDFTVNIVTTPVAILLKSIHAKNNGATNEINWSTSMENTGDYFELQHSTDGRNFSFMARIESRQKASDYIYYDEKPAKGVNYYRIKMTGRSGSHYSSVVTANVSSNNVVAVEAYPNPTTKNLTVKAPGNGFVTLTDLSGKVVYKAQMPDKELNIDMTAFVSGAYMLHYVDNNTTKVIKINKQ